MNQVPLPYHALARGLQEAFGPFYRITQLIISTTPSANSSFTTPSGLPAIVTDDHIRLLFDMQGEIDSLSVTVGAGEGGEGSSVRSGASAPSDPGSAASGSAVGAAEVRLQDVCLKPLGNECAVQSVLQYWKMSKEVFEKGPNQGQLPMPT
jgi:Niemann-Pick C1 protein